MIFARYPLAVILVLSALIRLVYVLWFADYPAYLFSDMRGYWSRALEYADGDVTAYNQWRLSPVFAHAVLGEILIVLRSLGLPEGAQLGVVLLLNVAMSVASTYFVFDMAWRFSHRRGQALAAAAIFGFFPALIHYDAFVLSENPTIFTVLLSLWLTLKYRRNSGPLLVAGLALGCATMFRTVMGLIGLPCFLFRLLNISTPARTFDLPSRSPTTFGCILNDASLLKVVEAICGIGAKCGSFHAHTVRAGA